MINLKKKIILFTVILTSYNLLHPAALGPAAITAITTHQADQSSEEMRYPSHRMTGRWDYRDYRYNPNSPEYFNLQSKPYYTEDEITDVRH